MLPSKGAIKTAITNATADVILPTLTILFSLEFLPKYGLYISIVKIVEVELSIDARDETIAAVSAARTNPFNPEGINVLISQG
jgi:hypothetical protein